MASPSGDAMLQALIYHSDNLELSEQFDGVTGCEKSVSFDLSYAGHDLWPQT